MNINKIFLTLAILGIIVFLSIIGFIIYYTFFSFDKESIVKLIVPLGVLISAGLASSSVMKSIENTNKIELKKSKKGKESLINRIEFYLNLVLHTQNNYISSFNQSKGIDLSKMELYQFFEINKNHLNLIINDKEVLSSQSKLMNGMTNYLLRIITSMEIQNSSIDYLILVKESEEDKAIMMVNDKIKECNIAIVDICEIFKNKYNLELYIN